MPHGVLLTQSLYASGFVLLHITDTADTRRAPLVLVTHFAIVGDLQPFRLVLITIHFYSFIFLSHLSLSLTFYKHAGMKVYLLSTCCVQHAIRTQMRNEDEEEAMMSITLRLRTGVCICCGFSG